MHLTALPPWSGVDTSRDIGRGVVELAREEEVLRQEQRAVIPHEHVRGKTADGRVADPKRDGQQLVHVRILYVDRLERLPLTELRVVGGKDDALLHAGDRRGHAVLPHAASRGRDQAGETCEEALADR